MGRMPGPLTPPVPAPRTDRRVLVEEEAGKRVDECQAIGTGIDGDSRRGADVGQVGRKLHDEGPVRVPAGRPHHFGEEIIAGAEDGSALLHVGAGHVELVAHETRLLAPALHHRHVIVDRGAGHIDQDPGATEALPQPGQLLRRNPSSPTLARPMELSMPAQYSAARSAGLPPRGSGVTALVTRPPRPSRSTIPSISCP
jgi:hypothetical protein